MNYELFHMKQGMHWNPQPSLAHEAPQSQAVIDNQDANTWKIHRRKVTNNGGSFTISTVQKLATTSEAATHHKLQQQQVHQID
jgi:hypothetical protein